MSTRIETRCIHGNGGIIKEHGYGAVSTPIYMTSTFCHGQVEEGGHNYTRESNPTRDELEGIVSSLEEAAGTVAVSSGMAAIMLTMELFLPGDELICTKDLYGGSVRLFDTIFRAKGIRFLFADTSKPDEVINLITDRTKAIYIETPSNPTMIITDIKRMSEIADEYDLRLIVDNTFLTPFLQKPLKLGADIVIHSGTKFLSGHNDVISGLICVKDEETFSRLKELNTTLGCNLSPFDSYLLIRGIKTLALRVERQQENAVRIADRLVENKNVEKVYFPGLKSHPGYEINSSQAAGPGSMISFYTKTEEQASRLIKSLEIISYAESLGGVESLITLPAVQTHAYLSDEEKKKLGITYNFVRLSVGIENVDDLIADLESGLS